MWQKFRFRSYRCILSKTSSRHEKRRREGTRGSRREEKEEEEEKKFAANGVSLMNAFFVSGKQTGPGTHLGAWKLRRREINKFGGLSQRERTKTIHELFRVTQLRLDLICFSLSVTLLRLTMTSLVPKIANLKHSYFPFKRL